MTHKYDFILKLICENWVSRLMLGTSLIHAEQLMADYNFL